MSHTLSGSHTGIFINGRRASEFMIYSWAAAVYGVPTVFLSGDKTLCEDEADLHPSLVAVPVKRGVGGATYCRSVEDTLPEIRAQSERSLRQDLGAAKISLPDNFEVEIHFNAHSHAEKVSHFPDVRKRGDNTIVFSRKDYYEVLRTLLWII
jgi:D-amino peptidase